jgi:hypothetical protein
MFSGKDRNTRFLRRTCTNMLNGWKAPEAAKDCENMDSCDDCVMLDQRFRAASEYYVSLIVQYDQIIRDGKPNASALDSVMREARYRWNAAGRLLLDHRISHEDESQPNTRALAQTAST